VCVEYINIKIKIKIKINKIKIRVTCLAKFYGRLIKLRNEEMVEEDFNQNISIAPSLCYKFLIFPLLKTTWRF